jgi:hypothetical protein
MPPPEDLPVHPIAAIFPMLPDEELRALADDIKRNGLLHPITLDDEGRIVDGRNRYKACGLAGVEPQFETLNGDDPRARIFGENVKRRHMGQGARAMAAVVAVLGPGFTVTVKPEILPKLPQGQRKEMIALSGAGPGIVDRAIAVYRYRPSRVGEVLRGGNLEQAYAEAMEYVTELTAKEKLTERLRASYPDLMERVAAGQITLETARAAADLFDQHAAVAKEIEEHQRQIRLSQEEIGAMPLSTGEPIRPPQPAIPNGETAGDVWEEIVGQLDFAALDANQLYLDRLKVRSSLLTLIRRYTPEQMADGLSMEDADYLASTMTHIMRWCSTVLDLAQKSATYGSPRLVR